MESGKRYTAKEIIEAAGFENTEDVFGKVRIRIGGISGIINQDHLVKIANGTKELTVLVGSETKTIEIE